MDDKRQSPYTYHLFCSYARADNDARWVNHFVANLSSAYRKLTGEPLATFFDEESILTSQIWQTKIFSALTSSRLMLALLSPSFFKSEWCTREWTAIAKREATLRRQSSWPKEAGLIVPVLLHPLDRARFSPKEKAFVADARSRQWFDFTSPDIHPKQEESRLKALVEHLIDALYAVEMASVGDAVAVPAPQTLITDLATGLMWSGSLSPQPMSFEEAKAYARALRLGGFDDWRLPTRAEMESLIDLSRLSDDPKATPYPLRPPFHVRVEGRIHSQTLVFPHKDDNWVMRLANAHIFNGGGEPAYVWAVRKT